MPGTKGVGRQERQEAARQLLWSPVAQGALRLSNSTISGTAVGGPVIAAMKASKPFALMRTSVLSITTSSAARKAASRTKSVRDRPRRLAARSIMAMSASGSRIDNGCSLRLAELVISYVLADHTSLLTASHNVA